MADSVNLDRINNNLRPISENDPELFRLATEEAERMAREGKLSAPLFTGVDRKTIILAMKYIGANTVRDFVVDTSKGNNLKFFFEIRLFLYKIIYSFSC